MIRALVVLLFILFFQGLIAQVLPPVQNYGIIDYEAGNQNWSITQGGDKHLFFGNNNGLLEFNGALWNLYPSPNGTIIRAVFEKDDLIYSGCYMELGFWKRNEFGNLEYTSLLDKLSKPLIEDEHFWNITSRDEWVLFQSLDRLYIYNTVDESFEIIDFAIPRAKLFNLKDKLYIQKVGEGLYSIQNGVLVLESNNAIFSENFIVGIYKQESGLLVLTENGRFYFVDNDLVTEWKIDGLKQDTSLLIYSSLRLRDGSFVLGTISDGYIRISIEGAVLERINQENGLANNTVLSSFQDDDGNLWLGLDNGISVVNLESVFKVYTDAKGEIGSVYATLEHNDMLYLGTNQGLFVKHVKEKGDFKLLKGTSGQVWNLKNINGTVFCSHTTGTFVIKGEEAIRVYSESGTWEVKQIPGKENLLIQGNYNGFSILAKRGEQWVFKNKIEGFEISTRSFEFDVSNKLIMNHEYKGIHILSLDTDFASVEKVEVIDKQGIDSHLFSYQDRILYSSSQGIFNFESINSSLVKDSLLSSILYDPEDPVSGKLIIEKRNDRLWGFSASNLIYVSPDSFDGSPKKIKLPIPTFFRRNQGVLGYENISVLADGTYVVGSSNGYSVLNLEKNLEQKYSISINAFLQKFQNAENQYLDLSEVHEFGYDQNNLICYYSIPNYDNYAEVMYQYKLIGLHDEWSKWYSDPYVSLENLPFGEYNLSVRGRVGNTLTENVASIDFKVNRPWYLSVLAIASYILIVLLGMLFINRLIVRYYRRQRSRLIKENEKQLEFARLEGEQEIMKLRNGQLKSELDSKNRELATTAMSLINKNELLQGIKNDLLQLEDNATRKEITRVIDKNLSNKNDWELFKEAFNNADKDFLHKIKSLHPNLTANDLKFCAFLRLNLSSKEIAPLLNISVRSVEIKRYRLRKKLKLEHSDNLIDYIIEI